LEGTLKTESFLQKPTSWQWGTSGRTAKLLQQHGVTEQALYRWNRKFG
jgi:hypothetical protein